MVRRPLTHRSLLLVAALTYALAFAPSVACLVAAHQSTAAQQHACCAGMAQACGHAQSLTTDCCAVPTAELVRRASAVDVVAIAAPVVVPTMLVEPTASGARPPIGGFDPGPPGPSSPPTYLFLSVFRL